MPLFGWRKRRDQPGKHAEGLANTTASKTSSAPSTSAVQVILKRLSANGANIQVKDKDLTKGVCQTSVVTISNDKGKCNLLVKIIFIINTLLKCINDF